MNRIFAVMLTVSLFLVLIGAVAWGIAAADRRPQSSAVVRYVAVTGSDTSACTDANAPCRTVQYAVDQAQTGDEIRIAAGAYTDIGYRQGVTQTIYLTKTLTLRGGFAPADWTTPDPEVHRTVLNAQGKGRVLYITGDIAPTLEGLRITGGDATGLNGAAYVNAGGGLYVDGGAPILRNCVIVSNTASASSTGGEGGGIYLKDSAAVLTNSRILTNTAASHSTGWGGGIYVQGGSPTLYHNRIMGNTASGGSLGYGGGLYLSSTDTNLTGNGILDNVSDTLMIGYGGGLYVHISPIDGADNLIRGNKAKIGAGAYLYGSDHNVPSTFTNSVIAGNQAASKASGLYAEGVELHLVHVTVVGNAGGDGSGVHVATHVWGEKQTPTTAALVNTVLVDHTVGITVTAGSTATLESTLWHGNASDAAGAGAIVRQHDHSGDPAFASDGYHLTGASAARDAGIDAGVTVDIDGDPRPRGRSFEIGADELPAESLYLPWLQRKA